MLHWDINPFIIKLRRHYCRKFSLRNTATLVPLSKMWNTKWVTPNPSIGIPTFNTNTSFYPQPRTTSVSLARSWLHYEICWMIGLSLSHFPLQPRKFVHSTPHNNVSCEYERLIWFLSLILLDLWQCKLHDGTFSISKFTFFSISFKNSYQH